MSLWLPACQRVWLQTGVAAAGWRRGTRSGIGRPRGLSIRGASARGGAPGPPAGQWPRGFRFVPARRAVRRRPGLLPQFRPPVDAGHAPLQRPDTRVGSDAKDPHRSRGSPQQRPYAVPTLSTGNAPCAASAEPPVLPPLRNPAACLKAAPTSWCGPASAAAVKDFGGAVARSCGRVLFGGTQGLVLTAEVAPLLRLRCSQLPPSPLSPVLVQMWQG